MTDRYTKLLEIVNKNKRIEVSKLAELLKVSQVTIRKDLGALEEKGLLKREHGYAVMTSSDDISSRLAFNYDIKRKIARLASELVRDGETVMIESGSSCALLAEELAFNKKDITIITNSTFIANYIREGNAKVVLLGGDYQPESQVSVGPLTRKCVKDFFVDKLFIGTDGYNSKIGFTGKNLMRTETVKAMAESADKIIILTDSSKFSERGVVSQFKINEISYLFTDDNIPEVIFENLKKEKVEVQMASVN
ncbi:DeoR/GlpR family transcriptional regulator of sugar metabolism [Clostridium saccharoperbutylacetonicum]|uniref:Lactose phosphotransferase system repressor n=1 Tax=Clostridium saccharoperbutylacetonicum N1-4(HMT) TaxID=931276 RepID=M1MQM6_9CLOT|nr:DeoR/GlpR family DNA-binding transcription regulator [Clostridium saccharoperbutylacetonicum]AGF58493.1 transcriptional regulator, DeoR family [Clostridium saccharoperbutylacetonicum N1-4(HMT)]NRT60729.1 DeoR/GlpR family transcriptional regulator of sugar metabolism [Clostridium saccharoperbutylacetonicum]NSB24043.1 DeoR/GlpR family transcriptional regulator of sugar metabolism [Clostridium saccharoperbutylacetonicum]NSB43421.1 DeoR/GlpR family transcriptional regulator of sugar metabolism [